MPAHSPRCRTGLPGLLALLALLGSSAPASPAADEGLKPRNRTEAVGIIADMRRIVTSEGIEKQQAVRIGGIDQWVSIRGNHRDNPVLLMLHGGPGWVTMPTSWYFQRGWEEYFTVVQWDQRGAGKTYTANDPERVGPTLTLERMVDDTEEMVAWLRGEFGQEKVFVIGHSWGSFLGLRLALRRPEWLHAYVGMGQLVSGPENEQRGWASTMARAVADGNREAIADLESVAPYATTPDPIPLEHLYRQRKWLNFYGGMVHGRQGGAHEAAAVNLAPEYTDLDVANVWKANEFSASRMLTAVLTVDFSNVDTLKCPIVLFLGRHDVNASSSLAAEWFETLHAPAKKLVWFEDSAHEMMTEQPGQTLISLVQDVLPFAQKKHRSGNRNRTRGPERDEVPPGVQGVAIASLRDADADRDGTTGQLDHGQRDHRTHGAVELEAVGH